MNPSLSLSTAFLGAIRRWLEPLGSVFELEETSTRAWSSGHFTGARHLVVFRFAGAQAARAADALLHKINRETLQVDGQTVAEIRLSGDERTRSPGCVRVKLEALTVCC